MGEIPTKSKTKIWKPRKPAWYKADGKVLEEYRVDLQERLSMRPAPVSLGCTDPHCGDASHSSERDSYVLDILCSVIESSHSVVPLAGGRGSGSGSDCVPGWIEEVAPFQQNAKFWYSLWLSSGKPNAGEVHLAMAKS